MHAGPERESHPGNAAAAPAPAVAPSPAPVQRIIALQRSAGNAAVTRHLMRSPPPAATAQPPSPPPPAAPVSEFQRRVTHPPAGGYAQREVGTWGYWIETKLRTG